MTADVFEGGTGRGGSAPAPQSVGPQAKAARGLVRRAGDTQSAVLRSAVDAGGTFTDRLYAWEGRLYAFKTPSTPADPSRAVLESLHAVPQGAESAALDLVHGSTAEINALLEGKTPPTALIVNRGFEDLLVIGRQNRPDLYALRPVVQPGLVPRERCFGISGRVDSAGNEIEALDAAELETLAESLRIQNVQSVAVCLLFSFLNPAHERAVGAVLARAGIPHASLSHCVSPEFREVERALATVVNAAAAPIMEARLDRLETGLAARFPNRAPTTIMQSTGGRFAASRARREPVRAMLSGPAGGLIAALHFGRLAGFPKLIGFDMGGTSTDVCLLDNALPLTSEITLAGNTLRAPSADLHTVGAGGGSIIRLDAAGALLVGPESAGADPGPAVYGRGEALTVSDANAVLGRLHPKAFLGGAAALHVGRAAAFFGELSQRLGMTSEETALAALCVAEAEMERALRVVSVERGFDPAEFALFSFGGAGGLHAVGLAGALGIGTVLVPPHPGLCSALGMLLADFSRERSRTIMRPLDGEHFSSIEIELEALAAEVRAELAADGADPSRVATDCFLDCRFKGQSFELPVPVGPDAESTTAAFAALHRKRFGFVRRGAPVQAVAIRVRGVGIVDKPKTPTLLPRSGGAPKPAFIDRVRFASGWVDVPFFSRDALSALDQIAGPALVVEYSSTLFLPEGARLTVHESGTLVVETTP